MADIRCPMCGKPNPDDLEVCQFCQARLKPLIINPEDQDAPLSDAGVPQIPEQPEGEGVPDWLRSMGDEGEDFEEADEPAADEADDWMNRLQAADDQFEEPEADDDPDDDMLSRFREEASGDFEDEEPDELVSPMDEPDEGHDDMPEWLDRLGEPPAEDEAELPPDAIQDERPSMESLLGEHGYDSEPAEEPEPPSHRKAEMDDPSLPEWLRNMDEDIPDSFQSESKSRSYGGVDPFADDVIEDEDEGSSGLLSRLPDADEPAEIESRTVETGGMAAEDGADEDEIPDWLSAVDAGEGETGDDEKSTPDWMSELGPQRDIENLADDEGPFTINTDWLKSLPDTSEFDDGETPPDASEQAAEEPADEIQPSEFPDWLKELDVDKVEGQGELDAEDAPTADWMSELGPQREIENLADDEGPVTIDTSWLKSLPDTSEFEDKVEESSSIDETIGGGQPVMAQPPEEAEELEGEIEIPEEDVEEAEFPDWLAGVKSEAGDEEPESEAEERSVPDWLSEMGEGEAEDLEGEEEQLKIDTDWLRSLPDAGEFEDEEDELEYPPIADTIVGGTPVRPDPVDEVEETEEVEQIEVEPEDEFEMPEEVEAVEEADFPDWLSELESASGEEQPDAEPEESDMPDWLTEMGSAGESEEQEGEEEALKIDTDWLRSLPDADEFEDEGAELPSIADTIVGGTPLVAQPSEEEEEPEAEVEEPQVAETDRVEDTVGEELEEGEFPDWLAEMEAAGDEPEAQPDEDESAMPDWLSQIGPPRELENLAGDEGPVSIDTSWLQSLPDADEFDSGEEPEVPPFEPESEIPAGPAAKLPETSFEIEEFPEEFSADEEPIEEGEMPDWLAGLKSEAEEGLAGTIDEGDEIEEPVEAEEVLEEEDFPDWLSDADVEPGQEAETEEELEGRAIPDWFAEVGPPADIDEEDDEDIPKIDTDWLKGLPDASEFEDEEEAPAFDEPIEEVQASDVPDWLQDIEKPPGERESSAIQPPDEEEEDKVPALSFEDDEDISFGDDFPDWLSSGSPQRQDDEDMPPVDEDLTPAEMPGWLAAMKPVEVAASDDDLDSGVIESAGPLVGLRSVLPAEPAIADVKKSVSQAIKLQVPEDQMKKATLLEQVLKSEGEERSIPRESLVSSQKLMRLIIGVILLGAIAVVTYLGTQWVPLPDPSLIPAEVLDASQEVNQISPSMPVLVAFDYEPGTTGEMTSAARPVLDHLMLRGANLVLVSTSPTGPALADRFISRTMAEHNYIGGTNYVNLGYLPGGASGLAGFAESPQAFTPFSFEGWDAWATFPVDGVNSLDDFAMLLVITDDAATARNWIEQVEPKAPNTPFVIVSSAQATPLIRPYYQSENSQVDGIVNGLTGGLAYEQATVLDDDSIGRNYWDAFNIGLIIAALAILVGAVVNSVWHISRNRANAGMVKEGE